MTPSVTADNVADVFYMLPTKIAKIGNKVAPANQEQADCRSAVVAHTNLQAGRGTTHEEDGHRAAGSTSFICVPASIRRHIRRELGVEPS